MTQRSVRHRNPFLRRPASEGASGKTILIVTEGEKTEPCYLKGLRNRLRLSAVEIRVVTADGTDALSVVETAISLRDQRKKQSRSGVSVPYDTVWAVFDTERADTNPKLHDALQKAKANKINVALSNPCFEFWLLLHFEYTTAPFVACANVIRRLRDKHVPEYSKGVVQVDFLLPKIPDAVRRAGKCREHHEACAGDGNPSTEVDKLVREMNEATRPHFRIEL